MKVLKVVGEKISTVLAIVVPVGLYTSAVWFFFGNFGWQVVLALALALPLMIFPAALIWYINVGGIYQAIRHKC